MRALLATIVAASVIAGCQHHTHATIGKTDPIEPLPPASEDRPRPTRDLGAIDAAACDVDAMARHAGGEGRTCRRVNGVAATGSEPSTSGNAFDGSTCTIWNSGGAPPPARFVAVDFGSMQTVTDLLVVTEMEPRVGAVKHVIDVSDDGITWTTAYVIEGQMATQRGYVIPFAHPFATRYLRVTTDRSDSWIAWREIVPLFCVDR